MAGLTKFIFGDGGTSNPQFITNNAAPAPVMPSLAPVPPPPDRTDSEIQNAAAQQRKKYGISGGRTPTNLTGGLGIPTGSIYSAAANVLGG